VFEKLLDTVSKDAKRVEFKCGCAGASLNNEPGESEVGKAMVSGGNIVLPCSEYDEPL
jgi:hypothetical protein